MDNLGGWGIPPRRSKKGREIGRAQHSPWIRAWQVGPNEIQKMFHMDHKRAFYFHILLLPLPRRVRAQEAIGEIEKERILLKQKLDIRNSDYEQKAQVQIQIWDILYML